MTWPTRDLANTLTPRDGRRVIDPQGKLRDPREVLQCLCGGSAGAEKDCDTAGFFARNLGYVEIGWAKGVAQCRLRPLTATAEAMQAAHRWLGTVTDRVDLHLWVKGWMLESYESGVAAAARLNALLRLSTPERPSEAILTQRRSVDTIFGDDRHRFLPLLLRWRISAGQFNQSFGNWLARYPLGDRLTIAAVTNAR